MILALQSQLLSMRARDEQVRAELAADGSLFLGYRPQMEEVHRSNARELCQLIDRYGWPHEGLVGRDGAEAAWLIAQHSIGAPAFMRRCRSLIDEASSVLNVPRWQFAYIDDRVNVLEGKAQRFGTQIDLRPEGPVPHLLEDPSLVDVWRKEAGLPSLSDALARSRADPWPSPVEYAAKQAAGLEWVRAVGWLT